MKAGAKISRMERPPLESPKLHIYNHQDPWVVDHFFPWFIYDPIDGFKFEDDL
jgi:hypothetical protein